MTIRRSAIAIAAWVLGLAGLEAQRAAPRPGIDWPAFRGLQATGVADNAPLPSTWDVPAGKEVRWKTTIEGLGHSSPVIWGDRIYITTAVSGAADNSLRPGLYGAITSVNDDSVHTWKLICLDKSTGKVLFSKNILSEVPKVKRHMKSTHANTTVATDGTHVVAMLGSEGLYAFTMNGEVVWKKDFGVLDAGYYMVPDAQWEFSSSPVIHDGVVLVLADVQKNSFLAAFDLNTGAERWRTARTDVPTFGTPTIHSANGRTTVIVNGWHHTGGYDFTTGREVWKLDGGGDIPVPTPIVAGGLIYITNAHGSLSPVYAIREGAAGDISLTGGATSNKYVAWSVPRDGSYMATPIVYRGVLYVCRWNGILGAFDPASGERLYQERLGEGTSAFTASGVAGDGKLYFTSEEGDVFVVAAGRSFELVAKNTLGELVFATPAISEGTLFFRTGQSMVAIGTVP